MNRTEVLKAVVSATMRWNFRVWGFGEAIALRGLLRAGDQLGDPAPAAFVHGVMRTWLGRGVARSAEDHVGAGRELLEMHRRFGDPAFLEAAHRLAALHESFEPGLHGARCHRADTPGWRQQIWVDCMDIDGPFLAQLAEHCGQARYFDEAAEALLSYARALQTDEGLLFHGHERHAGRNGQRWARGNGWALMGFVDTLKRLPHQHSARTELTGRLVALLDGLKRCQHESGLWHTVLDEADTYLESTLAAMAAHALSEALQNQLIEPGRYTGMARRARAAVLQQVQADGTLALVSEATPVGPLSTYATRPFGRYPWGQGPLLLLLTDPEMSA
jgi:unsaturated rhamnogalacturonyl hydrolase